MSAPPLAVTNSGVPDDDARGGAASAMLVAMFEQLRSSRSASLVVLALLGAAAAPAHADKQPPAPVMVYAIAWDKQCGGNSLGFRTQMADASNYSAARTALKESMAADFPNAAGIRAGSSKFEFGNNAGAVAVIEIDTSTSSCRSRAILVHFGVDEADAAARAAKEAGKRPYKTLLQQYFVKVTSAR